MEREAKASPKILVVDDEPRMQRLMEAMLITMDCDVVLAGDGEEAIKKAREISPDVILLDIMMPGMNGYEVARELKGSEDTSNIPVVMVTALGEVEDRVRALEAGADDFLSKPVDRTELEARVKSLVKVKAYNDYMRRYQTELEAEVAKRTEQLRRDADDLQKLDRMKSEFIANVTHELRTPLNAIIGFTELLQDGMPGEVNDEQKQFLADILNGGRHLHRLIDSLLETSYLASEELSIERRPVSVAGIVSAAIEATRSLIDDKGLIIQRNIPTVLPEVEGDEKWLIQVICNLLSNAVNFTPARGSITVSTYQKGDNVVISVADTGIGIPKEDRERIFDDFYQVSGGLTDKSPGIGLGLSLSKRIVKIHGGKIWAESNPGGGSVFYFTLPMDKGR